MSRAVNSVSLVFSCIRILLAITSLVVVTIAKNSLPSFGLFHACRCGIVCAIPASWTGPTYHQRDTTNGYKVFVDWETIENISAVALSRRYSLHSTHSAQYPASAKWLWKEPTEPIYRILFTTTSTYLYLQLPAVCHTRASPTWRVGYLDITTKAPQHGQHHDSLHRLVNELALPPFSGT
ncbi:hypothetical protein B0H65DRAFT_478513 [Neurospora tetraspora]|uniref:Uncharacterized protein n=1 Tax=Neurospora tetraspora TaxID=94610 RepID=A0AAE0J7H8_9PEZI|nr:hypothetical protein B0H65DRAFT_478513 [Neurospora tetraspora]